MADDDESDCDDFEVAADDEPYDNYEDVDFEKIREEYLNTLSIHMVALASHQPLALADVPMELQHFQPNTVNVMQQSTKSQSAEVSANSIKLSETVTTTTVTSYAMLPSFMQTPTPKKRMPALMAAPETLAKKKSKFGPASTSSKQQQESRKKERTDKIQMSNAKSTQILHDSSASGNSLTIKKCSVVLKRLDIDSVRTVSSYSSIEYAESCSAPIDTLEMHKKSSGDANKTAQKKRSRPSDDIVKRSSKQIKTSVNTPAKLAELRQSNSRNTFIDREFLVPYQMDKRTSGEQKIQKDRLRRSLLAANFSDEAKQLENIDINNTVKVPDGHQLYLLMPNTKLRPAERAVAPTRVGRVEQDFLKPQVTQAWVIKRI